MSIEKIMKSQPLEGIRILDFCQMWAGPHTTEWLSVLGAEVIKVENQTRMDYMRTVGAPVGLAGTGPDISSSFAALNWGKKSITLDMTQAHARDLVKRLLKISDGLAENFGGPVMERWGLSYVDVKKIKPDVIYFSNSGYGRSGPLKERPAYAEIVDAFTGATNANGYPGGEPAVIGVSPWTDCSAAIHGAFAMLTAIFHHRQTGEGQYIDASMIECGANFLGEMIMGYLINGNTGERTGNRDEIKAPHGCYLCKTTKDEAEWVAISVADRSEWKSLCKLMGNPDWTRKKEFSDEIKRWENQDELDSYLGHWTRKFGAYELAEKLQRAGITAAASLSTRQLSLDPHINARGFFKMTDHSVLGKIPLPGLPIHFVDSPAGNYKTAPLLGQHNQYVFGDLLGLTTVEIQRLIDEKVIY
jgi:crotonobetainyl-CoA:carnitine CoA-transferase CaiB-like acyl-CoA transferase